VHAGDREVSAHTVVLATGVAYRRLPAAGVDDFTGRGVYYGSSSIEASSCRGERVLVVGGANSAGQAALHLAGQGAYVELIVRGDSLQRSMSHYLAEQISAAPAIAVRTCTEVRAAEGQDHLERVVLEDRNRGQRDTLDASHLFIFIGASPLTDWLPPEVRRDDKGFVLTGPDLAAAPGGLTGWPLDREPYLLETSEPGVFAAGDVRASSIKRVASAVGEGALAVTLVHRYLEQQ